MATTDGNQYSFMQGAIKELSVKSIFTNFIIRGLSAWWVCCASTGLVNYPGQPARSLLACAAPLLILVRAKGGWSGSVAKDKAKAHDYWLPSVEITHRYDRMVGSVVNQAYCYLVISYCEGSVYRLLFLVVQLPRVFERRVAELHVFLVGYSLMSKVAWPAGQRSKGYMAICVGINSSLN